MEHSKFFMSPLHEAFSFFVVDMSEEVQSTQNMEESSDDEASSDDEEDKLHIADEEEQEETSVPRDLQQAIDAMNLELEKKKREHKERVAQIKAKTITMNEIAWS